MLGIGIEYTQIRLIAWLVNRKNPKTTAIGVAMKALLWAGMIAGTLMISVKALLASAAGCAMFTLGYAIAHFLCLRKGE